MKYLLGIDVGTTGTKTLLYSEKGELIAHDYMGYGLETPKVGFSQQNADDWWRAVVKTVRTVCKDREIAKQVFAVSLSLQGGTMVPVDEEFRPLRQAIVWNDSRCSAQAAAFAEKFGESYLYEKSGWHMGRGLNALQILWLRENEPDVYKRTNMFLSVPDFISAKMTGKAVVDISDAGINQLADIQTAAYDQSILDFIGIHESQLAEIVQSGQVIGHLTREAAEELGLPQETLLVSGAHDQYASSVGAGCVNKGDVLLGTGTAWVMVAMSEKPCFETGTAQSVSAVPGLWGSLVSLETGGVCLEWLKNKVMYTKGSQEITYQLIDEMVDKKSIGSNGLFFFPYFTGISYPENEPNSKASIIGLDLSHDCFDIARAVMEGVSYHIAWILESFKKDFPISGLKVAGGASKSRIWCQMVADITGLPVKVPKHADLACVGAAVIAGVGSGVFKNAEEGYGRLAVEEKTLLPIPDNATHYTELFQQYKTNAKALGRMYQNSFELRNGG